MFTHSDKGSIQYSLALGQSSFYQGEAAKVNMDDLPSLLHDFEAHIQSVEGRNRTATQSQQHERRVQERSLRRC